MIWNEWINVVKSYELLVHNAGVFPFFFQKWIETVDMIESAIYNLKNDYSSSRLKNACHLLEQKKILNKDRIKIWAYILKKRWTCLSEPFPQGFCLKAAKRDSWLRVDGLQCRHNLGVRVLSIFKLWPPSSIFLLHRRTGERKKFVLRGRVTVKK